MFYCLVCGSYFWFFLPAPVGRNGRRRRPRGAHHARAFREYTWRKATRLQGTCCLPFPRAPSSFLVRYLRVPLSPERQRPPTLCRHTRRPSPPRDAPRRCLRRRGCRMPRQVPQVRTPPSRPPLIAASRVMRALVALTYCLSAPPPCSSIPAFLAEVTLKQFGSRTFSMAAAPPAPAATAGSSAATPALPSADAATPASATATLPSTTAAASVASLQPVTPMALGPPALPAAPPLPSGTRENSCNPVATPPSGTALPRTSADSSAFRW